MSNGFMIAVGTLIIALVFGTLYGPHVGFGVIGFTLVFMGSFNYLIEYLNYT